MGNERKTANFIAKHLKFSLVIEKKYVNFIELNQRNLSEALAFIQLLLFKIDVSFLRRLRQLTKLGREAFKMRLIECFLPFF